MTIERPWEDSFCERCTRCVQEDMCNAYMFGMSYAFCPQIRGCERFKERNQTNADRIRAMSDEELARHLHCIGLDCHLCAEHERLDNEPLLRDQKCDENCFEHCLEWLKQPAEGE